MTSVFRCRRPFIEETLAHLRAGGASHSETVVLWLGTKCDGIGEVREVYRPVQEIDADFFRIPHTSMRALMKHIKETRFPILAQIHSHPHHAFHSKADDHWAIIRHVGAVSIVIPYFAVGTTSDTFGHRAATYRLADSNRWIETAFADVVEVV